MEGGSWRRERHGFLSLPLFIRPNTLLAEGRTDHRPDYEYADGVTLGLYSLEDGASASATVRSLSGMPELRVTASRDGSAIAVEAEGSGKPFSLELHGLGTIASVWGAERTGETAVAVAAGAEAVSFHLTLA